MPTKIEDAKVLVNDVLFEIRGTVVAPNLWASVPVSDLGLAPELLVAFSRDFENRLGIPAGSISSDTTLLQIAEKVVEVEIPVIVTRVPAFAFLFG